MINDNSRDYYCKLVECGCGNEWYTIQEKPRAIVTCDECNQLHDIWVDDFLMTGTVQEVIEELEYDS